MKVSEFRKLIREEIRRVINEANEPLDPNATYRVDVGVSRGEYDPEDRVKVSGNPLTAAKAVEKEAYDRMKDAGYDNDEISEFVYTSKIDQYTYLVSVGEEDVVIVGSPKSKTYGAFWADPTSQEAEDLYYQMEDNAGDAPEDYRMGGTAKVATKSQSGGSIKVGDIVKFKDHVNKGIALDLKVVRVFKTLGEVRLAIAKLPRMQGDKARQWFKQFGTEGPFFEVTPVKESSPLGFPMFVASSAVVKK